MIRDPDTLAALTGNIARFVRERLVPNEPRVAETDAIPPVIDAARKRDDGRDVGTEAACCKLFASEMCGRVADRAVQIHGGAGYVSDYAIERFYRDVRLFRIYEGTSQIQQLVIARNMIREARR
jgi:alkylation response protein AidB-like acyl-CoA dehydrogenase